MSVDISELIKREDKQPERDTAEDMMNEILRADMEMMLKYGRAGKATEFPDPVRPQWKN